MSESQESSRLQRRKVRYLHKMKSFLRSLHDLEEELHRALSELEERSASTARSDRSDSPERMPSGTATKDYAPPEPEPHCCHHEGHESHDDHHHDCPPTPVRSCGNQIIVNGTLALPAQKPDIETIIRFKPHCKVTDWQTVHTAEGRKIVVTGLVEIHMEYVAAMPDQPMHFAHFTVPFHTFFLCERPLAAVRCEVEFTHQELLDPRTISKVILLRVSGVDK